MMIACYDYTISTITTMILIPLSVRTTSSTTLSTIAIHLESEPNLHNEVKSKIREKLMNFASSRRPWKPEVKLRV